MNGNEGGRVDSRYLILIVWRVFDLDLVMISLLASKWQVLNFGMPIFQPLYEVKLKASKFKVLTFWCQWRYHDQISDIFHRNLPLHRGAFCQLSLWWSYYYGSNKSTRKETCKTHLCALHDLSIMTLIYYAHCSWNRVHLLHKTYCLIVKTLLNKLCFS